MLSECVLPNRSCLNLIGTKNVFVLLCKGLDSSSKEDPEEDVSKILRVGKKLGAGGRTRKWWVEKEWIFKKISGENHNREKCKYKAFIIHNL